MKKKKLSNFDGMFLEVEMIHQLPSYVLLLLRDMVDYELKDRKYLNKQNWIERMFRRF